MIIKSGNCEQCGKWEKLANGLCLLCTALENEALKRGEEPLHQKLIDIAVEITSGARRRDYGRPLINHLRIALEWSNYLGYTITADDVVWMMVGLKKARNSNTPTRDNMVDAVGYELCLDDMYEQMVELGWAKNYIEAMDVMTKQSRSEMTELLEHLESLDESD